MTGRAAGLALMTRGRLMLAVALVGRPRAVAVMPAMPLMRGLGRLGRRRDGDDERERCDGDLDHGDENPAVG